MKVFDLHCDTVSAIYQERKKGGSLFLNSSSLHLDLEKMRKGDYELQTFAIFLDKENTKDCFATAQDMIKLFKEEIEKNREQIAQVYTYEDIRKNREQGKMSALLSMEEGAIFEKSPEQLRQLYNQGARIATFTWNYENELGYPNYQGDPFHEHPWSRGEEKGLKKKGIEVLEQMEDLGVIPDVSHLSDGGFWDVARYCKKPFLATHSNARGAAPEAARNLTDPMIRTLSEKGGLMGLNYCVSFVREDWQPGQPGASLEELIRQVKYIVRVGGEECLALGSDFDGIEEAPEMENGGYMGMLAEAMERAGIPYSLTEKIFWKNADRFFRENL